MNTRDKQHWTVADLPTQSGRRVVVTGSNSGIGFETALELARQGAEVILCARTLVKAEGAADGIRRIVSQARVLPALLDLSSMAGIHRFATQFSDHFPGESLDLLINNAGVMAIPQREETQDGFERQFATNFLGPFALTGLLYPRLRQTIGTRVVMLSSSVARWSRIDFDNLQGQRRYQPLRQAYGQSKLADLIFALELQRRLARAGSPVTAKSAHPGYAVTNLQSSGPGTRVSPLSLLLRLLQPIASQSASRGALPTLLAACGPETEGFGYYGPDGPFETRGNPVMVRVPKSAENSALATRLWSTAEELTEIRFDV